MGNWYDCIRALDCPGAEVVRDATHHHALPEMREADAGAGMREEIVIHSPDGSDAWVEIINDEEESYETQ